jgi:methionyl-tRNA synthetase
LASKTHPSIQPSFLVVNWARETSRLCYTTSVTEYLNYENGKFSKSRGIGVFGNIAKETGIPPDVWRYHVMKNRLESGDTQFEWGSFIESNNSELLAKLGNFVNRVIKLVNSPKAYSRTNPQFNPLKLPASVEEPLAEVAALLEQYLTELEAVKLRAGLLTVMKVAETGNGLIRLRRLDNALITNNPSLAAAVFGTVVNLIYLCSAIFEITIVANYNTVQGERNTIRGDVNTIEGGRSIVQGQENRVTGRDGEFEASAFFVLYFHAF